MFGKKKPVGSRLKKSGLLHLYATNYLIISSLQRGVSFCAPAAGTDTRHQALESESCQVFLSCLNLPVGDNLIGKMTHL